MRAFSFFILLIILVVLSHTSVVGCVKKKNAFRNQFVTNFSFIFLITPFRDGLSHSAKRLSEPHRLDLMRNITELLGRTFPSQFVFPVLGHEDVQNSDYKDYKNFLVSLGSIWRQWLPLEALQTFEKGTQQHFLVNQSCSSRRSLHAIYIINFRKRPELISIDILK